MTSRLVPHPRGALAALVVALAVVATLGLIGHDATRGTEFDDAVDHRLATDVPGWFLRWFLHLANPPIVVPVLAVAAVGAVMLRRWDLVAMTVLVPVVSVVLTELIIKHLVHRTITMPSVDETRVLAYPSGHETGVASMVAVVALVLFASRRSRRAKAAAGVVLALVLLAATIAIVGGGYHYATDTVGAAGVVMAVVIALGLGIDRLRARTSPDDPRFAVISDDRSLR